MPRPGRTLHLPLSQDCCWKTLKSVMYSACFQSWLDRCRPQPHPGFLSGMAGSVPGGLRESPGDQAPGKV